MEQRKLLLIIDGSSLLSTSYYGNLPKEVMYARTDEEKEAAFSKILQTSKGVYTNGVYGFMKSLKKMIQLQKPTHVAVAFDLSRETTFRRKLYNDYKGTRKKTPAPLGLQFKLTQEVLEYIGVPVFKAFEFEADDYAGTLAKKFEDEIPVVLHSKDEDYLQLISHNTRVWMPTSKADELFDEVGLNRKEFNIPDNTFEYSLTSLMDIKELEPYQIVEYKALCGDSSDNIPGVKGVGEKAVLPLLKEYKNIETIYDTIENLDAKEEKELKKFFKESLGISRSPIANLLKEGTIALSNGEKLSYKTISGELTEEQLAAQEFIKEKLGETRFPIEITTENGLELLKENEVYGVDLSAKELAFLSKELATIKTDIEEIQSVSINDLVLNIDKEKYNEKMLELEMKSLI